MDCNLRTNASQRFSWHSLLQSSERKCGKCLSDAAVKHGGVYGGKYAWVRVNIEAWTVKHQCVAISGSRELNRKQTYHGKEDFAIHQCFTITGLCAAVLKRKRFCWSDHLSMSKPLSSAVIGMSLDWVSYSVNSKLWGNCWLWVNLCLLGTSLETGLAGTKVLFQNAIFQECLSGFLLSVGTDKWSR